MNTNGRHRQHLLMDNSGFTLLEIIAVLVILAILAVVAVPRYFDLQASAQEKAIATALAEGLGRVNGQFAKQLLDGQKPDEISYTTDDLDPDLGDFTLASDFVAGATQFTITVTGKANTPMANVTTKRTIRRPGQP